jgi:hypothetical protein
MKVLALSLMLCVLAGPDSCDQSTSRPGQQADLSAGMVPKTSINSRRQCSADHRFVNMSDLPLTVRGDVALDTCTGQLCKTWEWVSSLKNVQNSYQALSLCSELAKQSEP